MTLIINSIPNATFKAVDGVAYLLAIEGQNELGEEESVVAQADYNNNGLYLLYLEAKKRWKEGALSKCYIVGVKNGKFCYRRPDMINFSESAKEFTASTLAETKTVEEMEKDAKYRGVYALDTLKNIDRRYNMDFCSLLTGVTK